MRLGEQARQAIEAAVRRFVEELSGLLEAEANRQAAEMMQGVIKRLVGDAGPPSKAQSRPARSAPRRRSGRNGTNGTVEQLVSVLRAAGGSAKPGEVSKALDLTPERRRQLVAQAVAQGLMRTTGKKWSTVYVLSE